MNLRRWFSILTVAIASLSARDLAAQTDVIRGKVIGPDSAALPGVQVSVTSISGNVTRTARTDTKGNFSISFPNGDGDYMVSFSAMGFAAKRFEVKRTVDQEFLVADAKLARAAVTLDAMTVQQARNKPNRNDALATDISGSERGLTSGLLGADQAGDLAAMAGSLPGFTYIPGANGDPGGFSVFGLDPSQNLTTLNGLPFSGNNLPRDAGAASSVQTSPYDVASGGFSGGNISIRARSGNNFIRRSMSFVGQAPSATWTDAAGRASGAAQTYGSFGGALSGPISFNKAYYFTSVQFDNTTNDLQSLLTTDATALRAAGMDPTLADSALRSLPTGMPRFAGASDTHLNRSGRLFGSFDITPPTSNTGTAYNITYNGSFAKNTPSLISALDLPAHGGEQSNWSLGVSGRHNAYFGFGILTETSVGTSASGNELTPFLDLPSGSVRVSSNLGGGSPVVRTINFGGNQIRSTNNSLQQSFRNTLSWFSSNNKHRLKMTTELNYSHSSSSVFSNEFGTFSYQSLADLASNTPSSYSRQLNSRDATIGNLTAGWSLGDSYRPNQDLQVQYGVRVDGNHFMNVPSANPQVEALFGERNQNVPTPVLFSPRVGFTKTLGTAPDVVAFDGQFRAPRAVLSGGAGVFQNFANTGQLSQVLTNTGLPGGIQQLQCVGTATPTANWTTYEQFADSVPSVCANGAGASTFTSTAPNVSLFAKNYIAPRSLRGNLAYRAPIFGGRFMASINNQVNYSPNQTNAYDLNFRPSSNQFTLGDEGGRKVFVDPAIINQSSGLISATGSRGTTSFNQVNEIRSDLRSFGELAQISVTPYNWNFNWRWSLNYTYADNREQTRGFTSTAGDPRDVEWSRSGFDTRHTLGYTFGYLFFGVLNFSWNQQFISGAPFTPMVSGDVNGDGRSFNDRAFVFTPATAADPAVASGMQSLLANGSKAAKECLSSQLGALAGRNTCEGPWTSRASLNFSFDPVKTHMPQRLRFNFQLLNPLAAFDLALHGENSLHGWGQTPSPDQTLLFLRGFDATNKRFIYDVNQRFGSTSLQNTLSRTPVKLSLTMSYDVGPTLERQSLSQQLDRGRSMLGAKLTEQMFKSMYSSGPVPNPLGQILRQADTLELTRVQADSLAALNRWYTIRLDSIWTPIGKYLGDLPDHYDQSLAYDRYLEGRRASIDLLIKIVPTVKSLLTPAQIRKLGSFIGPFIDERYLLAVRESNMGANGAGSFGFGPVGFDGGVAIGGGDRVIIIR